MWTGRCPVRVDGSTRRDGQNANNNNSSSSSSNNAITTIIWPDRGRFRRPDESARRPYRLYDGFIRLAETRLAQNTLNYIHIYEITLKQLNC